MESALLGFGIGWVIKLTLFKGRPVSFLKAFGVGVLFLFPLVALYPVETNIPSAVAGCIIIGLWKIPSSWMPKPSPSTKPSSTTTRSNPAIANKLRTSESPEKDELVETSTTQFSSSDDDEQFYAQAAAELQGEKLNQGLWAKCFAECDGDENKAKALYLKKRVQHFTGEA